VCGASSAAAGAAAVRPDHPARRRRTSARTPRAYEVEDESLQLTGSPRVTARPLSPHREHATSTASDAARRAAARTLRMIRCRSRLAACSAASRRVPSAPLAAAVLSVANRSVTRSRDSAGNSMHHRPTSDRGSRIAR
jgi:hypothetical protein